jgi:alpha-N-acetylglucosaminidase
MKKRYLFFTLISLFIASSCSNQESNNYKNNSIEKAAAGVLERTFGDKLEGIKLYEIPGEDNRDVFEIEAQNGEVLIGGSSPVALSRGIYQYIRDNQLGMVTWNGTRLDTPKSWPEMDKTSFSTPYKNRYYLNVCAFGYSTPYWDWNRWEKEIDWMALHGMNFPLALVAYEAIATRVWGKIGLSKEQIDAFYTGPSLLPWQRMGNINDLDGDVLSGEWHEDQIALQHKILSRMKELEINPIVPAFAGFVPKGITNVYTDIELHEVSWGGLPEKYRAYLLNPGTPLFNKIGKLFIEEWEKEFGKCKYFLADSFNEMQIPETDKPVTELLADYGSAIYESLKAANPDAVWVVQGWMFTYQRNIWNKKTTNTLFSRIPDDKLMILDYAYEYNGIAYKNGYNYDVFEGYNNKPWIYGFMLNSGGKTGHTGVHDYYATNPIEMLNSPSRKNVSGFGFAPEGIENNEVTFELVADMAWRKEAIDLDTWYIDYSKSRYGACPDAMAEAWQLLRKTSYGTMTDHPRFGFQSHGLWFPGTINKDPLVLVAIEKFLSCADELKDSELYRADALEFAATALCHKAEDWFGYAYNANQSFQPEIRDEAGKWALQLLTDADRLLEGHPTLNLQRWIDFARSHSKNPEIQDKYEVDARRIVTVWGAPKIKSGVNDYAARMWGGLIRDYYRDRMALNLESLSQNKPFDKRAFEDDWVLKKGLSEIEPFANPLASAQKLVKTSMDKPIPVVPEINDIIVGDWTMSELSEEWTTKEWAIKREYLPQIKGVKLAHFKGRTTSRIKKVELIADGEVIAGDEHINPIGRDLSPQYTLKVPEGAKANNGLVVRVTMAASEEGGKVSGKAILMLEGDDW